MKIKSSVFYKSSSKPQEFPVLNIPRFAFIGRSNVGKSSLINMLVQRKNLARTSSKPGKTQLINHFLINDKWFLIDLPGYGYSNLSKAGKSKIRSVINNFFSHDSKPTITFVLIDIRHEPQKIDLEFFKFLNILKIQLFIIFTKSDKIKSKSYEKKKEIYLDTIKKTLNVEPISLISSSITKQGREEILNLIQSKIN
ncbi:MAG: YihA family ribosome biogenesis GTP-binding protein [Flavobacteriaceae bacterium]|nr:YihA family ribosome biogenesis GTP-binding protein [Flavobacteriaceae bacterium]